MLFGIFVVLTVVIPEKIRQNNSKKYGSASDLRTVRHRVITRLIYDAKNGKFEN